MKRLFVLASLLLILAPAAMAQSSTRTDRTSVAVAVPQSNTVRLLNQRIPEVSFDNVPFEQVMDWVGEITGANVVVRWQTLEDSGIDRDKPITIKVKNLRLSQVLWMIMNEAAGSDLNLAYRASGSLLILSTEEDLAKEMVVKVYDVSDLLTNVPRFNNAATMDPSQALNQAGQGGQGGGGGGSNQLFQSTNRGEQGRDQDVNNDADIQKLIELITQTVEPDTWVQNGGEGSIYAFRNVLIVSNSLIVHQRIGGYVAEDEVGGPG